MTIKAQSVYQLRMRRKLDISHTYTRHSKVIILMGNLD